MNLSGWLIYKKEDAISNKYYIDSFLLEAKKQHVQLQLVLCEDLICSIHNNERVLYYKGEIVQPPDFAVMRTINLYMSLHLEALGVIVCNSSAISMVCNNKALTHHHVHTLGVPMTDTIFIKDKILPEQIPFAFPLVIKNVSGRGGTQVYMVKDEKELRNIVSVVKGTDLVIQTAQAIHHGKDVRVFVIGKEIIGAVLRESTTDFRANFKLGGTASWYELTNTETKLVNKIAEAFDFDLAGIDFLVGKNGNLLFNEIEDVVGSRTLYKVSNINLLEKYVAHIIQKCRKEQQYFS